MIAAKEKCLFQCATKVFDWGISQVYLVCRTQFNTYNGTFLQKYRSIHRRCYVYKSVLRNFAKFTGKRLYQSLFFIKITGLRPAALLKKRIWRRCFPVNFAKFPRKTFLQNTPGRLLLKIVNGVWPLTKCSKKLLHRFLTGL